MEKDNAQKLDGRMRRSNADQCESVFSEQKGLRGQKSREEFATGTHNEEETTNTNWVTAGTNTLAGASYIKGQDANQRVLIGS